LVYHKELDDNFRVCPRCDHHLRLSVQEWLAVLDVRDWQELDPALQPLDPLDFHSPTDRYRDKLEQTQRQTGLSEAVISGRGTLGPWSLILAICDFRFIGASMGSVYGEKIARAAEQAAREQLPLLTINASVGARQQEGMLALMQMAKIPMALQALATGDQPHIALVVDHCYGGVSASYVGIADIIIAEPGTRIGFAGPRVIEQTIREHLPPDFQTAEFMLVHGMIDMIVPRRELRHMLQRLLGLYRRA
jgi:acetyl-CoA carboxylase carboxyl transferase subunit beta